MLENHPMKKLIIALQFVLLTSQAFAIEVSCSNENGDVIEGSITRTREDFTSGEWTLKPSISSFDYSIEGVVGNLSQDASMVETPDNHWSLLVFKIFPGTSDSILFSQTQEGFKAKVVLGSTEKLIQADLDCTLHYPPRSLEIK
jgi:hypothetical protein